MDIAASSDFRLAKKDLNPNNHSQTDFSLSYLTDSNSAGSISDCEIQAKKLGEPVTSVKFVGTAIATRLKRLGITTVGDLLYHFPHRYLDPAQVTPIAKVKVGQEVIVVGTVRDVQKTVGKRGTRILSVGIYDGTGYLYGVWFNQNFIADRLTEGTGVSFRGKTTFRFGRLQIQNPLYDLIGIEQDFSSAALHTQKIVTFHPATAGLSTNQLRRIIKNTVEAYGDLTDPLPAEVIDAEKLLPIDQALRQIHFPDSLEQYQKARDRFIFEELFMIQLGLAARKKRIEREEKGIQYTIKTDLLNPFYRSLPFSLTSDQQKAVREIQKDMNSPYPMNRLLQGEVGAGKTVVALAALLTAVQAGYQGVIMAPTEVLAMQHNKKINSLLKDLPVKTGLLIGSQTIKEKTALLKAIVAGEIDIIIGTHALIQKGVEFCKLGLVIIDEQHRFGVRQRLHLKEKGPKSSRHKVIPDVLIMTATPIPRTLSLTLYGDLDVSLIKERPDKNNLGDKIDTVVCDRRHRPLAYEKIKAEVSAGRQAFIICPLIEESDTLRIKSVLQEAERLKTRIFPQFRVGLLHGRMRPQTKEQIMDDFNQGRLDILISTTVVEVGIDIPNVSVILIEDADRFGLSQLHQLRGRVGRGRHKSYCFLFADPSTEEGRARMKAIAQTEDGFQLADKDLEIRGEGQLFGEKQSGLPDLRLARLTEHFDILLRARKMAFDTITKDPTLESPRHRLLRHELQRRFKQNFDWIFHA